MDAQLTAQPTPPTPAEQNDDRYIAICSLIKVRGEALREEMFVAIESGDFETALKRAETIQYIDRCYMLSLQKGMGIQENNRKRAQAAAAIARANVAPSDVSTSEPEISPARKSLLEKIFRR